MRATLLFASIATLLNAPAARSQSANDIQFAIDTIYSLCVGGGGTVSVSGEGKADASLSLKKLDAAGNFQREVTISQSQAKGLVNGLNDALSSVAAEQADKVRKCIEPYRDGIMNLILSPPPHPLPSPSPSRAVSAVIQLTHLLSRPSSPDEILSKLQVPFCSLRAIYTTDDLRSLIEKMELAGHERVVVSLADFKTLGGINFRTANTVVERGISKCASYGIFTPLDYLITVQLSGKDGTGTLDYIVDRQTGLVKGMFVSPP